MKLPSENDLSRDNQQERLRIENWIVGFVDGEGCFSVSIFKNRTTSSGWQVLPEFVVTQGAKSVSVLIEMQNFFKCGRVFVNRRHDNHREDVYRYCVRAIKDLRETIIPFFDANPLRTAKRRDYEFFKKSIQLMSQKTHHTEKGIDQLRNLKSQFLESSETIRQNPVVG